MKKSDYTVSIILSAWLSLLIAGCESTAIDDKMEKPVDLGMTIGSLATLYKFQPVEVKGYGIVAGLAGTGSSECDPRLRVELVKYIRQQIPVDIYMNANKFIDSKNTAVVEITGIIPAVAMKGDNFDIRIRALADTQTTSLVGGRLYTAELKESVLYTNFVNYLTTLGTAHGPIYTDNLEGKQPDPREGYILGGGTVGKSVGINVALFEPNYFTANAIRNKLNERYGMNTARALGPGEIQVTIPDRFMNDREKFLEMVGMTFLPGLKQSQEQRIEVLIKRLVSDENKLDTELSLEAIGKGAAVELGKLLDSKDEAVRFHAARCLININEDRGLEVLRDFANNVDSRFRLEAVCAIGIGAKRNDASVILNDLLDEDDFPVRLAAYEQLRRLGDISVMRKMVAGDFFVDRVMCGGKKAIYVSRKSSPRIVIFSSPVRCEDNIFVETPNRNLTINARKGDDKVSLMRKHPGVARPAGPIMVERDVAEIVRTFCERPDVGDKSPIRQGLGASYSDMVVLLEKMCAVGAIKADFIAGDLTEVK